MTVNTRFNAALSGGANQVVVSFCDHSTFVRLFAVCKQGALQTAAKLRARVEKSPYSLGTLRILDELHVSLASLLSISPQELHKLRMDRMERPADSLQNSEEAILREDLALMPFPIMRSNPNDARQLMLIEFPPVPGEETEPAFQDGTVAVRLQAKANQPPQSARLLIMGPDKIDGSPWCELTTTARGTEQVSPETVRAIFAGTDPNFQVAPRPQPGLRERIARRMRGAIAGLAALHGSGRA